MLMLLWDLWIWKYCFPSSHCALLLCCIPTAFNRELLHAGLFWRPQEKKNYDKFGPLNLEYCNYSFVIMGSDNHMIPNYWNKATLTSVNAYTDTLKPNPTLWEDQGCTLGCLLLLTWTEELNNQASSAYFFSCLTIIQCHKFPNRSHLHLQYFWASRNTHFSLTTMKVTLSLIFTNGTGKSHFTFECT